MKRLLKQGLWCVHEVREGASMTRGGRVCGGSRNCANPRACSLNTERVEGWQYFEGAISTIMVGGGIVAEKEHRSKVT